MHPYTDLIAVVQESASDIVEHQMIRDRQRFQFEKHKLALLLVLILTLWIMFFLLWEKLDELRPIKEAPAGENHLSPPHFDPVPPDEEAHYAL